MNKNVVPHYIQITDHENGEERSKSRRVHAMWKAIFSEFGGTNKLMNL